MDKVIAVEVNPVQLQVEAQPLQREARELAGPPEVLLVAHQLAARPDVEVERIAPALEPLEASVTFAEGGDTLSDDALADLEAIMDSP